MFRLDINALRFIAVIGVVLFHFKVSFVNGGYAGVDIFFVISGYLMYSILSKKDITFKNSLIFYKKRLFRIYPALLVMLILASAITIFITPPSFLSDTFKEIITTLSFTSNIYFWRTLNYFSGSSDGYFLLHTWSLGVEFQYYIIFPVILYIIKKFNKFESLIISILVIFSIILMVIFGKNHSEYTFYLLPFRAWEFLLGALAFTLKNKVNKAPKTTEILSLSIILLFYIFVQESLTWPNLSALIPTLATALILHANVENNKILLKHKYIQNIGLWSYSIYLVHWPIVSILYFKSIEFTFITQIIATIVSIFLGFLSYKFVEQKFTFNFKTYPIFIALTICSIFLIKKYDLSKYWSSPNSLILDQYLKYASSDKNKQQFSINSTDGKTCFLTSRNNNIKLFNKHECLNAKNNKKNILLLGDSHAAEFSSALKEKYINYNFSQITASGCPAIIDTNGTQYCKDLMNFAFKDFIESNNFDLIIVGSDWNNFYSSNDIIKGITSTNNFLKLHSKKVYFISQTMHFNLPVPQLLQIKGIHTNLNIYKNRETEKVYNDMNSKLVDVNFIDLYNVACKLNNCKFILNNSYEPIFFDNNHFSPTWASMIAKNMM